MDRSVRPAIASDQDAATTASANGVRDGYGNGTRLVANSNDDNSSSSEGAQPEADRAAYHSVVTFDTHIAQRHTYLGEFTDLSRNSTCVLQAGDEVQLPLLPLDGVIMVPGANLPLRIGHSWTCIAMRNAVSANGSLRNLLAVLAYQRQLRAVPRVGCVVELKQQSEGSALEVGTSFVAKGLCRFQLIEQVLRSNGDVGMWASIRVLPEPQPDMLPREVDFHQSRWPRWALQQFDCYFLADNAKRLLHALAPQVTAYHGDPVQLSYWLLSNLPLDHHTRQKLLEAETPCHRLTMEVQLLRQLSFLYCKYCNTQVAHLSDMLSMSDTGVSGIFVNTHGYVHDMLTLRRVDDIVLEGEPEVANSWFPGYAWTIAHCPGCEEHMGWRFTATQQDLMPNTFYGLRRDVLTQQEGAHVDGANNATENGVGV